MKMAENNLKNNSLQVSDLLAVFKANWAWFVLSLVLFLGVTIYFIMSSPPRYKRTASILVKDETRGGNIGATADIIAGLGFFQSRINIQNELLIIQAPIIIRETVEKLALNERYSIKEGLRFHDLYRISPIIVNLKDKPEDDFVSYIFHIVSETKYEIIYTGLNSNRKALKQPIQGEFDKEINTDIGKLLVSKTLFMDNQFMGKNIYYSNRSVSEEANNLEEKLKFELGNRSATVIDISIDDVSIQRGDDILSTIIGIYEEAWIKDKNQIAEKTSMFINERLGVIEEELGVVDNDISTFKSKNLIPDAQAVSNRYLDQSSKNDALILDLNTQYSMAQYIKEYLQHSDRQEQLIPANSGIDAKIEKQIIEYNSTLLERNKMLANSSSRNPLVQELNSSLKSIRNGILLSIDDLVKMIDIQLSKVYQQENITKRKISQNPTQVEHLLSIERQQKIKEALYLFLLQKREENELTYSFSAYNTRIVSPPMGNINPVFPQKFKFLLIAVIIGLMLPGIILIAIEGLNTKVKSINDLRGLSIPIVGMIPWSNGKNWLNLPKFRLRKQSNNDLKIIVNSETRNPVNEAFRVIRTNIDLIHENNPKSSVVMVTSMDPMSGKSFIANNLSICMGLKGCRVLVVDFDFRKATTSSIVGNPQLGVADFLNGKADNIEKLILKSDSNVNVDILPAGNLPQNPSDLLANNKVKDLVLSLKPLYDYILLDCTSIDSVADAALVNKVSDIVICVIRAGLFDKSDLSYIRDLYTSKAYNNIKIVLNNSDLYGRYGKYKKTS